MLGLALLFLIVAIVAFFLGANQAGAVAVDLAKWCFLIFVVLVLISVVFGALAPGPYWHWPFYGPVP